MSASQRNKGASYEREVCAVLSEATGRKIQRHIGQSRDGGNDITVGNLVIECKRRKTLGTVEGWLRQAQAATVSSDQIPVVVARSDGGNSLAILSLANFVRLNSHHLKGTPVMPSPMTLAEYGAADAAEFVTISKQRLAELEDYEFRYKSVSR